MALAHKCGLMEAGTRAIGVMIRLMAKESWCMPMEMSMKANGSTTKHMEKALTHMLMEPITTEIGLMTSNMVGEWNLGLTVPNMRAIILTEKKKAKVNLLSLMAVSTKGSSDKMKYAAWEDIIGQMVSNMKVNGVTIKCMGRVH